MKLSQRLPSLRKKVGQNVVVAPSDTDDLPASYGYVKAVDVNPLALTICYDPFEPDMQDEVFVWKEDRWVCESSSNYDGFQVVANIFQLIQMEG